MRLRGLLIAPLLIAPAAASARDVATCAALYRQLANLPQVIGNTDQMRRYAQELAQLNIRIRELRIEMRQAGCGTGSIVVFGGADAGTCDEMRQALQSMEEARDTLTAERKNTRDLVRPSDERSTVLAAIRSNACTPSDVEADEKERLKVQGLELPKQQQDYSGVTSLRTTPPSQPQAAASQPNLPGPERPYDPNKKVRTVGPVFLPEENIDLAHPKSSGPQAQQ